MRPADNTYPDYYRLYIPLIKDNDVLTALGNNKTSILNHLAELPEHMGEFAYAPSKWTVKQLLSHICDTERILAYRALRFARRDPQQPLPFEEDQYAANAELHQRSINDLAEEFSVIRQSTILLYKSFSDKTLLMNGHTAIGDTTVLALGFMICGHALHHVNILQERYLAAEKKLPAN